MYILRLVGIGEVLGYVQQENARCDAGKGTVYIEEFLCVIKCQQCNPAFHDP